MAAFAKFDSRAFLEREVQTTVNLDAVAVSDVEQPLANNRGTLATLATLAAPIGQNENRSTGDFSSTADDQRAGEDQKSTATPAKFAKVAKAEKPSAASENPWDDAAEERAAIIEHDGGVPRIWAEALARLDPGHPPCDVPAKRWVQFIDDCGRFLDEGWAPCAERLGWTPFDLFGCDRHKPYARIDRMGLLWLLNGRRLLVLAADMAAVATPSGGNLKYRRSPHEPDRVLVWELAP